MKSRWNQPDRPSRRFLPDLPNQKTNQTISPWPNGVKKRWGWEAEAEGVRNGYRVELEAYEGEVAAIPRRGASISSVYGGSRAVRRRGERRIALEASILPAEELIRQFYPGFGWTFVDKDNTAAYQNV